jgi:23S rRNA (cytosine1962-C5)-methyltransferase
MNATVLLKSGRDKSVRQRHPRLFAGAIKEIDGKPKDGEVVDVADNKGEWLARGVINQQSQIAVRLMTWDAGESIDDALWQKRSASAIALRNADPLLADTSARRLIFGESDGLPGVIADDYAAHIVVELSTLAAIRAKDAIAEALNVQAVPRRLIFRIDEERLKYEFGGTVPKSIHALFEATEAAGEVEIHENGLRFIVNLASGQKTGFYLDQRENRMKVARYCKGATVLNVFSFTGAFGVHALAAGATAVVNVDSSADALALAARNAALNAARSTPSLALPRLTGEDWVGVEADAFADLRERRARGEQYDVVILDPPKFAHNVAQIDRAARAYKDLNRIGMALVKPGGVLATFSCSGVVDATLMQKIVFSAALEAHREARIMERLTQASDHPVLLTFPESEYLKGFILRIA